MEDAASITLDLESGVDFYAVYDGHGGSEISRLAAT